MATLSTQEMVESLVNAYSVQNANLRQKHIFEQTLHALVRLAKSEQMMEIKTNVRKLTGPVPAAKARSTASKAGLAALAQLALPGLEEKVGVHDAAPRRRK